MGFFDSLFGGGKKQEAPKTKPKKVKTKESQAEAPAAAAPAGDLTPEVIAAISASVGIVMEDASAEMVAAVTAAIVHARGGGNVVRFRRNSSAWAATGRQKIMDSRQYS
ncbi:MAG: hypothetical protein RIN56_10440 [Sporomusaceae bacterium]|nr:hypothetical protein [Sporomusaceae bacterium]